MGNRIRGEIGRSTMRLATNGSRQPELGRFEFPRPSFCEMRMPHFAGFSMKQRLACPSTIRLRRMVPLPEASSGRIDGAVAHLTNRPLRPRR